MLLFLCAKVVLVVAANQPLAEDWMADLDKRGRWFSEGFTSSEALTGKLGGWQIRSSRSQLSRDHGKSV